MNELLAWKRRDECRSVGANKPRCKRRQTFTALFAVYSPLLVLAAETSQNEPPCDLVLKNANVYTVNDRRPKAQGVAVRDGRIVFVGSNSDGAIFERGAKRVIDLRGATVVPGLTDSHYHLSGVGERELTLNLEGTASLEEMLSRVAEKVHATKPGEWVYGRGWIESAWKPQRYPMRQDLDRIAPDNPLFLVRADGHGVVVNSAALKIAGITKETKSPFGGEIMRDAQTGEANGMLADSAVGLVQRHMMVKQPPLEEQLRVGADRSVRVGWTQVQAPSMSWAEVDALRKLYREGKVKLRVYGAIYGPGPGAQLLISRGATIGEFGNRLTVRGIKMFADGSLGSKSAALLEPYHDYNTSGFLTLKEEMVRPLLEAALRKGIQVETHACGDRGARFVLDQYEKALKTVPPDQRAIRDPRWRVEHAQLVHPMDVLRFHSLGVIPSMQPSHAIGDLHFAPSRLGMDRLSYAYAWKSFLDAGCVIAGGSDAPVERGEPMIEFYAAVYRHDLKGFAGPGWHLEQAVSREQALKMFTFWPAYAAFEERIKGSIEPGKLADFTVLSADIMRIPPTQIPKTRCLMTIIGGEVVYDASKTAAKPETKSNG